MSRQRLSDDVFDKIISRLDVGKTITERSKAITDLKQIFEHPPDISSFGDSDWKQLIDCMWQFAAAGSDKTLARLEKFSDALQFVVRACVTQLKIKTVKTLVKRIIEPLSLKPRSRGLSELVALNYLRTLRYIFEYQPHVEHLGDKWRPCFMFCIQSLDPTQDFGGESGQINESVHWNSEPSDSRTARGNSHERLPVELEGGHDIVVSCMKQLCLATNAPLQHLELPAMDVLESFMGSTTETLYLIEAMATINIILSQMVTTNVASTEHSIVIILPHLSTLWLLKSAALKDNILSFLIIAKHHIKRLITKATTEKLRVDLEQFLDAVSEEYASRMLRDQLRLDEICLDLQAKGKTHLPRTPSFKLREGAVDAEGSYMTCQAVGWISAMLDESRAGGKPEDVSNEARKRRRITSHLESLTQSCTSKDSVAQLAALQQLSFYAASKQLTIANMTNISDCVVPMISHPNGIVASWSMIVLANCAFTSVTTPVLKQLWSRVWELASRAIPSQMAGRASSLLLDVLLRQRLAPIPSVTQSLEQMLQFVELTGPGLVADSTISFWITGVGILLQESPGSAKGLYERLLRWLFSKWTPSSFDDGTYLIRNGVHAYPHDILRFLEFCTGKALCQDQSSRNPYPKGTISQAWLRHQEIMNISDYLLLWNPITDYEAQHNADQSRQSFSPSHNNADSGSSRFHTVIEYCCAETTRVLDKLLDVSQDRPSANLTSQVARNLAVLCLTNDQILAAHHDESSIKRNELSLISQKLIEHVTSDLARIDSEQAKMDAVLLTIAGYLPCFAIADHDQGGSHKSKPTFTFILKVWEAIELRERPKSQLKLPFHQSVDTMDFDDEFESQISTGRAYDHLKLYDRDHYALWSDMSSFRISMAIALKFASTTSTQVESLDILDIMPDEFLNYLINLPSSDLIRGWQTVRLILKQVTINSDKDMLALLEHVTDAFLMDYAYTRHDVGLSACLDMISVSPERWSKDPSIAYGHMAVQTYDWFVTVAVKNNIISPKVVCEVVDLLFQIMAHQGTNFKPSDTAPALHDVILELLGANLLVRFHLAGKLPHLFEQFTLGEHENIFQGIFERLPLEPGSTEGMVIRILVLSKIASKWQTLLRRGTYHIFEAAGKANETAAHATYCVSQVCSALSIQSPRDLFKYFVSQLLYTWLREGKWETIPFAVFGYSTLEELFQDINDEVVGQALIHGGENGLKKVSEIIGRDVTDLLSQQLAKAAAYSFATDAQRRKPENAKGLVEIELKRYLDSQRYGDLLRVHYPRIIAILFNTVKSDEDLSFIKTLSKDKDNSRIGMRLSDIRNLGCSSSYLYLDQQPHFSTRHLLENLVRVCRRTGRQYSSLWSEAVYVYVLRYLLQTIQTALGSSYACSVLRKIRLLIAIAGKAAFEPYALEMTLHAVQPFLVDQQCANDAIGIVHYLLEPSTGQLTSRLSFVSGFVTWSMVSLQQFSMVPQDSTTQENEYLDTLSKAETFGQWLHDSWCAKYIAEAEMVQGTTDNLDRFKSLIHRASSISKCDPAQIPACKVGILKALLEDRRSPSPLIIQSMQDPILALVYSAFEHPASMQDDVLGANGDTVTFAPQLWEICTSNPSIGKNFLLWSSKVLGRAQNSSAHLELATATTQSSQKSAFVQQDNNMHELEYRSTSFILQALLNVMFSTARSEVGFAEQSLRFMLSTNAARIKLEKHVGQNIPREYIGAFKLVTPDTNMPFPTLPAKISKLEHDILPADLAEWLKTLVVFYTKRARNELLQSVTLLLRGVSRLAIELLAPILHLLLAEGIAIGDTSVGDFVTKSFDTIFRLMDSSHVRIAKVVIQALLYLREQPFGQQATIQSGTNWLKLDYIQVSRAAEMCGMYTAALLFAETAPLVREATQPTSRSRVSIKHTATIPDDLLRSIYENIDEPDSFYGVHQDSSLNSVLERLEYENDGYKSLLFNGARLDSKLRRHESSTTHIGSGVVNALSQLNLNSIALAFQNSGFGNVSNQSLDQTLLTARKLEQWDVGAPDIRASDSAVLFKVFQGLHSASHDSELSTIVDRALVMELESALCKEPGSKALHSALRTLSVLEEVNEIISCRNVQMIEDVWSGMWNRYTTTETQLEASNILLSSRETLFSIVATNKTIQRTINMTERDALNLQIASLQASCQVAAKQNATTSSLATVTYLFDLLPKCREMNLTGVEGPIHEAVSDVLWAHGEQTAAINILRGLSSQQKHTSPTKHQKSATMLAKLGHYIAEARLESTEEITRNYLEPALRGLKGKFQGGDAGKVLHEFAVFCDKQLHNAEFLEDFERVSKAREKRQKEIDAYTTLIRGSKGKPDRDRYAREYRISKKWHDLDDEEFGRIQQVRQSLVIQSLENYLRSLAASDDFDADALRFFSIWLEYADNEPANKVVSTYLPDVSSSKFALLMNQLTAILQNDPSTFQVAARQLVIRICKDHPHHSLHHLFAGSHSGDSDPTSKSRCDAMKGISATLKAAKSPSRDLWSRVYKADSAYHSLAVFKDKSKNMTAGHSVPLDALHPSKMMMKQVPELQIPPATLDTPLRADRDYSNLPRIVGFKPKMTIASGISAPKILTAIGSDGLHYKQLFKGGNDDLRQDAIMEQVFDRVSLLLKNHTATRRRKLHIRTYKVLPLTATSGIIEFVQNTIPLSDYLQPAHTKYFPSDHRWSDCRNEMHTVHQQTKDPKQIVKVFRKVIESFHPVLHFFFLERFLNPDEWFERRLAYTRSTAAISILGHVLGLGDRHCHNILLDQKTGEAVHIDLGIAFEAGRILPVPEVVPFRLSRDIVSAMGHTKTEGVFRRSCEFTLDALREERESIMTLLNVLKYDPLVSWTVSPLRAKRMQERETGNQEVENQRQESAVLAAKNDDEGQAGRALRVVEKKLSKALSTAATVSELTQQAADERNLAVLYPGWAPWA